MGGAGQFLQQFNKSETFKSLNKSITPGGAPVGAIGVADAVKPYLISSLITAKNAPAFIITPDEVSARRLAENMSAILSGVQFYPEREFTFQTVEGVSHDYEHMRLGVLTKILSGECTAVVASVSATAQMTMPPEKLKELTLKISVGDDVEIDALSLKLVGAGYSRYDQVDGVGQFAVRGGIIDIYPPGYSDGVRVELWGNEVDSIYSFDVYSQRRVKKLDVVSIIPASEVLFDNREKFAKKIEALAKSLKGKATRGRESLLRDAENVRAEVPFNIDKYLPIIYESHGLFDYMADDALLFVSESKNVKETFATRAKTNAMEIKGYIESGALCKGIDNFTADFGEVLENYERHGAVYIDSLPRGSFDTPVKSLSNFNIQSLGAWNGTYSALVDDIKPLTKAKYTVCVLAGTERNAKALAYDLTEDGFNAQYYSTFPQEFGAGLITVVSASTTAGFKFSDIKFAVITHNTAVQKKRTRRAVNREGAIHSLEELSKGDYIVHNVHGIGIFDGIEALEFNGVKKDYIKISYAKGDVLYVPVTQLDLVSKYIGPGDNARVKINRLGKSGMAEWKKTKAKVHDSVKDMARELIDLYAKRMAVKGHAFSEDTDLQRDFELRFQYDETEDQLKCTREIKHDMEREAPMDRLLCGDVGVGKTEVALRAAFKCISDGKQCAILVPTTVLAMQHYSTAKERMQAFPVNIAMLSRFVSAREQKEILKGLKTGTVDLLIGTHRMIGKDIEFKDLGLLIVDEEQRFGVGQKEKIKERFPRVDVLTLSATPIPRTLNMAMSGIRDMSIIEEPPNDRYPVQTYVVEYDFEVVIDAMAHELSRGGQCYYLHNDIETIEHTAVNIKRAIPEANVGIAHGRMTEDDLTRVWQSLLDGDIDILVCTTIIETGVDVPNVNTLIVENADRMGLAQLHQIRGRVGRSSRRAYAYLTFTRGKQLTDVATKRLEAIREYTEFGSGFKIAMRDLEIRGAGSLLGSRQHGHMESVGYDMYLKLLADAVAEEKGEVTAEKEERECLVDLPIEAHIPESYISSTPQRLEIYKRIAAVRSEADAKDVYDELTDRFGPVPNAIRGLVEISLLRNTAAEAGIYEISQRGGAVLLFMTEPDVRIVIALDRVMKGRIKLNTAKKTFISINTAGGDPLETTKEAVKIVAEIEASMKEIE